MEIARHPSDCGERLERVVRSILGRYGKPNQGNWKPGWDSNCYQQSVTLKEAASARCVSIRPSTTIHMQSFTMASSNIDKESQAPIHSLLQNDKKNRNSVKYSSPIQQIKEDGELELRLSDEFLETSSTSEDAGGSADESAFGVIFENPLGCQRHQRLPARKEIRQHRQQLMPGKRKSSEVELVPSKRPFSTLASKSAVDQGSEQRRDSGPAENSQRPSTAPSRYRCGDPLYARDRIDSAIPLSGPEVKAFNKALDCIDDLSESAAASIIDSCEEGIEFYQRHPGEDLLWLRQPSGGYRISVRVHRLPKPLPPLEGMSQCDPPSLIRRPSVNLWDIYPPPSDWNSQILRPRDSFTEAKNWVMNVTRTNDQQVLAEVVEKMRAHEAKFDKQKLMGDRKELTNQRAGLGELLQQPKTTPFLGLMEERRTELKRTEDEYLMYEEAESLQRRCAELAQHLELLKRAGTRLDFSPSMDQGSERTPPKPGLISEFLKINQYMATGGDNRDPSSSGAASSSSSGDQAVRRVAAAAAVASGNILDNGECEVEPPRDFEYLLDADERGSNLTMEFRRGGLSHEGDEVEYESFPSLLWRREQFDTEKSKKTLKTRSPKREPVVIIQEIIGTTSSGSPMSISREDGSTEREETSHLSMPTKEASKSPPAIGAKTQQEGTAEGVFMVEEHAVPESSSPGSPMSISGEDGLSERKTVPQPDAAVKSTWTFSTTVSPTITQMEGIEDAVVAEDNAQALSSSAVNLPSEPTVRPLPASELDSLGVNEEVVPREPGTRVVDSFYSHISRGARMAFTSWSMKLLFGQSLLYDEWFGGHLDSAGYDSKLSMWSTCRASFPKHTFHLVFSLLLIGQYSHNHLPKAAPPPLRSPSPRYQHLMSILKPTFFSRQPCPFILFGFMSSRDALTPRYQIPRYAQNSPSNAQEPKLQ
ncbi:uncharacterized protein BDR25DRAFT_393431 [Lindgomyces ingoldianus]|uniref:Uncharacterized protein n=1 Tax=Lindgomyces ingoldianus TaxID=673940 RepID=A0ACB6QWM6_9PLEO|nr:uncharacterized protein BDR25DRAFT_393431 [Lindgomyces ingoldianus]KAF2471285.1 hypothetical protein BDR25DRAFT_393431 [Lindgomyces ingoldianus]